MTNGYETAQEQRNWLERLGEKIPGYKGYQDRELRRDVDRLQREHLAAELGRIKTAARRLARDYTDAGKIGLLHLFDRLDRRLDGLSQAVRFANYGYSGFFDVVKVNEAELERLYKFDLAMIEEVGSLAGEVAALPAPGAGEARQALERALARAEAVSETWAGREQVVAAVS